MRFHSTQYAPQAAHTSWGKYIVPCSHEKARAFREQFLDQTRAALRSCAVLSVELCHLLAPVSLCPAALLFALLALRNEVHFVTIDFRNPFGHNTFIEAPDQLIDTLAISSVNFHISASQACFCRVLRAQAACPCDSPPPHRVYTRPGWLRTTWTGHGSFSFAPF